MIAKIMRSKVPHDVHVMLEEAQIHSHRVVVIKHDPGLLLRSNSRLIGANGPGKTEKCGPP